MRGVEALEQRSLLAAVEVNDIVMVMGSPGKDRIQLSAVYRPTPGSFEQMGFTDWTLWLNGRAEWQKSVRQIGIDWGHPEVALPKFYVDGLGGSDVLDFSEATSSVTLLGGGGNDTLYGSHTADALFGGAGNDNIRDGGGADFINAGAGNDSIRWGQTSFFPGGGPEDSNATQDVIHGGTGQDTVITEQSETWMFGSGVEATFTETTIYTNGLSSGPIIGAGGSIQYEAGRRRLVISKEQEPTLEVVHSPSAGSTLVLGVSDGISGSGPIARRTVYFPLGAGAPGLGSPTLTINRTEGTGVVGEMRHMQQMLGHYFAPLPVVSTNDNPIESIETYRENGRIKARITMKLLDNSHRPLFGEPVVEGNSYMIPLYLVTSNDIPLKGEHRPSIVIDLGRPQAKLNRVVVRTPDGHVLSKRLRTTPR